LNPASDAEIPPGAVSSEVVVQLVKTLEPAARRRKRKNEELFIKNGDVIKTILGSERPAVEQKDALAQCRFSE